MTLDSLTFTGGNGAGFSGGEGGAILNENGALALNRCTLFGNSAQFRGGTISGLAGLLTLTQCTLSGNSVTAGGVNNGGGAIFSLGNLSLTHCTISGNSTAPQNQGGGIINAGPATLAYCIVAENSVGFGGVGPDIKNESTLTRLGANLILASVDANGGSSSGPTAISAPAKVSPLGSYGGDTPTRALLPGSPARNAATGSPIGSDQRGFPIVGPPDLGAYEAGTARTFAIWAIENIGVGATFDGDADGDGRKNGLE